MQNAESNQVRLGAKLKMRIQNPTETAQSLLEVLTALGVAILIIVGLSALAVYGLRNAQHSKNTETATRLTGQAIEEVRTVRDRQGWTVFSGYRLSPPCYRVDSTNFVLAEIQPDTSCENETLQSPFESFSREIRLTLDTTNCPGECRKITVTVFWTDSTGQNQVSSNTFLTER